MREAGVVFSRLVAHLPLTGTRISSEYGLGRLPCMNRLTHVVDIGANPIDAADEI